jgi:hypothetical protein
VINKAEAMSATVCPECDVLLTGKEAASGRCKACGAPLAGAAGLLGEKSWWSGIAGVVLLAVGLLCGVSAALSTSRRASVGLTLRDVGLVVALWAATLLALLAGAWLLWRCSSSRSPSSGPKS